MIYYKMEYKISWILLFLCVMVIYLISTGTNKELTPNMYLLNTYLYITLAVLLIGSTWLSAEEYNLFGEQDIGNNFIMLIIVTFASLLTTLFTTNDQIVIKHVAWLTFVLCLGFTTYLHFKKNVQNKTLLKVLIRVLAIMGGLSYIAYTQPLDTFMSWGAPLTSALGILIAIEIFDLCFLEKGEEFVTRIRIYSWIAIMLFSGFVLYDTQKLLNDGINITDKCLSKSQAKCADYPKASLGLLLDAVNLFQNVSNVSN